MSNKPADFLFLPLMTEKRSTRQNELVKAEVRAQTARQIHQRRKEKKNQEQLAHTPSTKARCSASASYDALRRTNQLLPSLCGSSDPFQSFPIGITPEINHVVTIARDVLVPNLWIPSYVRRLSFGISKTISQERAQFSIAGPCISLDIDQFRHGNEGVASAWLSGHMAFLNNLGYRLPEHDISTMELRLRTRSLELLRKELSMDTEVHQVDLSLAIEHIMLLFQADCKRRDSKAASVHGPILMSLIEKVTDNTRILQLMIVFMFGNTDLAAMTVARPVINLSTGLTEILSRFWALASSLVNSNENSDLEIHPTIENHTLRRVFIRLRAFLSIAQKPLPVTDASEKARGLAVYSWIATATFSDMSCLLNLHHDLMIGALGSATEGQRLTEACIALGLLQTLRKSVHEAEMDGRDLRDASHVIIPKLQETLNMALEAMTPKESSHYGEAYLWMYFVGAQYEQRCAHSNSMRPTLSGESPSMWFTGRLSDQAILLNVQTWIEAKRVLECFVYDKHLIPDGGLWFEKSIAKDDGAGI